MPTRAPAGLYGSRVDDLHPVAATEYHYVAAEVSGSRINIRAIRKDGRELDNFSIAPAPVLNESAVVDAAKFEAFVAECGAISIFGRNHRAIAGLDAKLFDAYNRCDLETLAPLFADDVEFYHDQSGVTRDRRSVVEAVKKNICGKVRRELVSMEVYPLHGFGAIQSGVHRFHQPAVDARNAVGKAKFFQIWEKRDGMWRLTRVISYDHVALKKLPATR